MRAHGRLPRIVRLVRLAAALAVAAVALDPAQAGETERVAREIDLKVALLFKLAEFVEWPAASFSGSGPMVIGIVGRDPFGSVLDEYVRGATLHGRPVTVERFATAADVRNCHIVFLGGTDDRSDAATVAAVRGQPVLTVSDHERFLERGGMIQLFRSGDHMRMRLNKLSLVRAAGLNVSARLLALKRVVEVTPE